MKINKELLILIGILAVGFYFRVAKLGQIPVSLYWDEAAIAYDAYSVAQTGRDMHSNPWHQAIFPSYGDYKLPAYIWLTAFLIKLVGPTAWVIRLPSALAGTLLILVVYWLGKELLKSKTGALVAAGVIALSPWAIHFSRTGFEANVGLLFVSLFSLKLLWWRKSPLYIWMAGVWATVAVFSYFSTRFVLPAILVGFIISHWNLLPRKVFFHLGGAIIAYFLLTLPIFLSPFTKAI